MYADDGVAHLRLDDGELLTCVRVPAPNGARAGYEKARVRGAIDFPLAGVAIALKRKGGKLAELRCALTGTDPRPVLVEGTGALAGAGMNDHTLRRQTPRCPRPGPGAGRAEHPADAEHLHRQPVPPPGRRQPRRPSRRTAVRLSLGDRSGRKGRVR
jgi:hypothetical protein